MGEEEGLKSKKNDFKSWFSEVIIKAGLIDHSKVSGCSVFLPWSYFIWEQLQFYFNKKLKKLGVENAYFPLLIPEEVLMKEKEHIAGFAPEVAWVTKGGKSNLEKPLAIRPTSETVMYDLFSKWIRSYRDLPFKINQWCNVVRWEFKTPIPFLRNREFLWQEGHTVHRTQDEVTKEVMQVLQIYSSLCKDLYAVPVILGEKTPQEKFAGAESTYSVEAVLPDGKTIQLATSHNLGQGFAKSFGINYLDEEGNSKLPWQASWGISTRSIGVAIIAHGDDKGLVLPPPIAYYQAVIIPIFNDKTKDKVLKEALKLKESINGVRVFIDDSEKSPGWKFNNWELKGVPLRIELGPRDIEKKQVVIVKRNTGEKRVVKRSKLDVKSLLKEVHQELYDAAVRVMHDKVKSAKSKDELYKSISNGFAVKCSSCGDGKHEDELKESLSAKSANMPFGEKVFSKCVFCGKEAKHVILFSRQY